MWGVIATGVCAQVIAAMEEAKAFDAALLAAPESERQGMLDRREAAFKAAQEERRHQELVEAAKPKDSGIGPLHVLAFMFGVAIS